MATTIPPLPRLDRTDPDFPEQVDEFFADQLPDTVDAINIVGPELETARDQAVAARNETVPLANQVITLAPQAIAASNNVSTLAPQVAANAAQVQSDKNQVTTMVAGATQIQMGGSTGYPTIGPSLICNFAHAQRLSRKLSFSRAGAATYVDQLGRLRTAASGMPVFEFNAAGRSLGYRSEPARTNVSTQSEGLNLSPWSQSSLIGMPTAASAIAGIQTFKLIASTASANHYLDSIQLSGLPDNTLYSASVHFPRGDFSKVQVGVIAKNGSGPTAVYDFNTSSLTLQSQGSGQSGITFQTEPMAGGLVRLKINGFSTLTGATAVRLRLWVVDDAGTTIFPGDGVKGALFGGAQIEAGASSTSYIPTTTAAVTRPADILTLPTAAAADVVHTAQGVLFGEFTLQAVPSGTAQVVVCLRNLAINERLYIEATATSITASLIAGGAFVASIALLASAPQAGTRYRFAVGYSVAGIRGVLNGGSVAIAAATSPPALTWDRVDIGHLAGAFQSNAHHAQQYIEPRLLTDAELVAVSRL